MTERAVTVQMGAHWSRYKTWIPRKRLLLHDPPTSKRSQAIQVSKLPSPGAVTPCCCTLLLSAGEPGSSGKEATATALGETLGDGSHGSAGRSTQASPGAVLIPAAQALPPVPIHCRCAGEQGAREAGSPLHSQPTLLGPHHFPARRPPAAPASARTTARFPALYSAVTSR